ncbi:MAG: hypothetical protein PSX36_02095, partial [bacterium]|nr:hypothetical protein [bacterium]
MKNLLFTLSVFALTMNLSVTGQIDNTKASGSNSRADVNELDTKSRFIANQDYLSASSLKDYANYYGDSLKGFDEVAARVDILNRHFFGEEFRVVMNYQKRDFIDRKYGIGQYAPRPVSVTPPPSGPSKPISGGSNINVAPCVNEDFEATTPGAYFNQANAVTGWTIASGSNVGTNGSCPTNTAYVWPGAGSPEFWIVQTPIFGHPYIGTIANSPLGGTRVAQLQNTSPGVLMTKMTTTFPVTAANTLFQFAYCGSWDGSGHSCCDQPFFIINMFDCLGNPLGCSSLSLTAAGPSCVTGLGGYNLTSGVSWINWTTRVIDLTPYIGTCVTLKIINGDCDGGAHHGSLYFDARCGGQLVGLGLQQPGGPMSIPGPVSFCAGSNQAQIAAPLGYQSYSWTPPISAAPIPPSQATLSSLTVTNPIPGQIYTVTLVSPSGCVFTSTNAIAFSTVNIAGIGSTSTCIGGASGSATVQGNGSGSGYNYTWINAGNSATVGTTQIVNGLAPGVYSVMLTGIGASGCGSAWATTTVFAQPSSVIELLKPYCGNEAYLATSGGTNFQWYNGLTAISPTAGGTASSYTVITPSNLAIWWLSYTSQYGCRDSIKYTLVASPPGGITIPYVSWICPGGSNGVAYI